MLSLDTTAWLTELENWNKFHVAGSVLSHRYVECELHGFDDDVDTDGAFQLGKICFKIEQFLVLMILSFH